MILIKGCEQHQEGDGSFFQPLHFTRGLEDKTIERLCNLFVEILEISEACTHPYCKGVRFLCWQKIGFEYVPRKM